MASMDGHDINDMAAQDAGLNLIYNYFLKGQFSYEEMLHMMIAYLFKTKQELVEQITRIHTHGYPAIIIKTDNIRKEIDDGQKG
jgi:hypothetical protein